MTEPVWLTAEGKIELQRELAQLLDVKRPELARKLKEAVAQGDLKENADYHDTREQKAFVEGRIQYLEVVLRSARIIKEGDNQGIVRLGSVVTIREIGEQEDETYRIVGAAEANPREGKISHESPIGRALLGCRKGSKVQVRTPGGEMTVRIRNIE
ncbi:MAG: transcription elongation factor GreA [Anaerolineaceae bacterium]|nr:transcription elongation factor GreA [Anaerolineaceae bacterium]